MMEEDFERYWLENRRELLAKNKEYREIEESYKMRTGFDWLLWALPVVVGILTFNVVRSESEVLKWLASAGAVIVVFLVCVWVKSAVSGHRPLDEVEKEVKAQAYEVFKRKLNQP